MSISTVAIKSIIVYQDELQHIAFNGTEYIIVRAYGEFPVRFELFSEAVEDAQLYFNYNF
jgi:hypothetical protein